MKEFILRKWEREDAESIAKVANNPRIAGNLRNVFPYPYSLEDAKAYVEDCIRKADRNQLARAIVVDGKAVGSIGVFVGTDIYERSAEMGYWLSEDCWRQGIMTRAVRLICTEAFEAFDIIRIFAEPFACNEGSRGVLEKAGFTYEGTMRDGVFKNGKVQSYCIYSVLRGEAGLS